MPKTGPGATGALARAAALLVSLAALACDPGAPETPAGPAPEPSWIDVTVGGIPEPDRRLLVLPPSGSLVDVSFARPEEVLPDTLTVSIRPWSAASEVVLEGPIARRSGGATFIVPSDPGLSPGSHTLWATVQRRDGATESVSLAVASRVPHVPTPLSGGQWIQLDFEADRDGDSLADFPVDLATFGLAGGISPSVDIRMESWVIREIVERTAARYRANPSRLPQGDPLPVRFSAEAPAEGPYSRICVAGATPGEDSFIGNVLLDPGNQDRSDEACDDFLPSGVFPRELVYYEEDPAFQDAFGPLRAAPPGSDPRDPVVLGPRYDPTDAAQRARLAVLTRGVETFAQAVASVVAHEAGHAMGLVPPGPPGVGLYGGIDGAEYTHNLTPDGDVPEEKLLMNPGPTLGFSDLSGSGGTPLPRLRALNFAYLQGRVILDARVDALHPPPQLLSVSPRTIESDGSLLALVEIRGTGLLPSPSVVLRGDMDFPVLHVADLAGQKGAPATLIGQLLVPTLVPGRYDVEVTNPDGQRATLRNAIEVR